MSTTSAAVPALESLVRCSPVFADVSGRSLSGLAAAASLRRRQKGQFVFIEGDKPQFYYLLLEGRLRVFKQTSCGKHLTILLLQGGDTIGEFSLFNDNPVCVSAQTLEESLFIEFRREEFLSFVFENVDFARRIVDTMASRARSLADRMLDLVSSNAEVRVTKAIASLFRGSGAVVPVNHQEVADMAGTSRETVCRVMARLQQSGTIRCLRGSFVLLDKASIMASTLAQDGASPACAGDIGTRTGPLAHACQP